MSPDEGITDEEVSAYITAEDTGRDCWDRRLRVRHGLAVFMANRIRAHRASGEGGSTSALRASAPEGFDALRAERDKLAAFKAFVHRRLDEIGVPVDPPGEHRDAGCRIGQRIDWLVARLVKFRDQALAAEDQSDGANAPSPPEGQSAADILHAAHSAQRRMEIERDRMHAALVELVATVRGECPALLDEDRGGSAVLIGLIDAALPPQADAAAHLARASHSLAPEGISAGDVATIVEHLTGAKLADDRAAWAAALLNERAKPTAAHVAVCGPVSQDEAKAIGSMIAAASKMMADQSPIAEGPAG